MCVFLWNYLAKKKKKPFYDLKIALPERNRGKKNKTSPYYICLFAYFL